MRSLFIVYFLSLICILPSHASNRWALSENLAYPENFKACVKSTPDDYVRYVGQEFCLNTENIHYLNSAPLYFLSPESILDCSTDKDAFVLKNHIEMVEMSEMKILSPGEDKTALLTLHVFPCVVITAFNKAQNRIGMAHIAGTTRDNLLNFEKNPLNTASKAGYEKIEDGILGTAIDQFLSKVTQTAQKDEIHIQLFGGYKNRELLLKTAQKVTDCNYSIFDRDIHWAHSGCREKEFQKDTLVSFDILMGQDGQVHIIKENSHLVDQFMKSLKSLENTTLKQSGYPWLFSEWNCEDSTLMDRYLDSVTDPDHFKKFYQFEKLYLQVVGQETTRIP